MKTIDEIKEKIFNYSNIGVHGGLIKLPDCGTCTVCWGYNEGGYEHVSVSPKHRFKMPSWDDMAYLKDAFFYEEEEAYQIMPKHSEYVNLKENCLHIWRPCNGSTLSDLIAIENIKSTSYSLGWQQAIETLWIKEMKKYDEALCLEELRADLDELAIRGRKG